MTVFRRLAAQADDPIRIAVTGAGFVARGLIHQVGLTPGIETSLVVARRPEQGVAVFTAAGATESDVVVSDSPDRLTEAISAGKKAVTSDVHTLGAITGVDVLIEATGDVEYGAVSSMTAIAAGIHVVSLNYETEATVGPLIAEYARRRGVVYTGSDGDQPGVMMRMIEYVRGIGLDVVAAVNCKGFLDYHATPKSIKPWSEKQGTSPKMTTAFTDGTKMNVENCCVANAAGLSVERRGMIGVETTLGEALESFRSVLSGTNRVDYTLGGDFGSGIFVIGTGADPDLAAPYLSYLKMGDGPRYLFYRPWHLVHFETPISIAEAVLDGVPTIAPNGAPQTQVVTHAKRDLPPGQPLDGIGGWDHYGLIDAIADSSGQLPVGLAEGAVVRSYIETDDPVGLDDVDLDEDAPIVKLWRAQESHFEGVPDDARIDALWAEVEQVYA